MIKRLESFLCQNLNISSIDLIVSPGILREGLCEIVQDADSVSYIKNIVFVSPTFFDITEPLYNDKWYLTTIGNTIYAAKAHSIDDSPTVNYNFVTNNLEYLEVYFDTDSVFSLIKAIISYYHTDWSAEEINKHYVIFNKAYNRKKIEEYLNEQCKQTKQEKQDLIEVKQSYVSRSRQQYLKECEEFEKLLESLNLDNEQKKFNQVLEEFEKILNHPKVVDINIKKNVPVIKTLPIVLTEPETNCKFQLGSMFISLPLTLNENIKILSDVTCDAFWSDSPHPHINEYGGPCWGTADAQLVEMLRSKNYYAAFITILSFLETCDISDCAGSTVTKFNCISTEDIYQELCSLTFHDEEEENDDDEEYDDEEENNDSDW